MNSQSNGGLKGQTYTSPSTFPHPPPPTPFCNFPPRLFNAFCFWNIFELLEASCVYNILLQKNLWVTRLFGRRYVILHTAPPCHVIHVIHRCPLNWWSDVWLRLFRSTLKLGLFRSGGEDSILEWCE